MNTVNSERASSQLRHYVDRSTIEPQNEEHGGGVTSSDVVMENNPAYQELQILRQEQ